MYEQVSRIISRPLTKVQASQAGGGTNRSWSWWSWSKVRASNAWLAIIDHRGPADRIHVANTGVIVMMVLLPVSPNEICTNEQRLPWIDAS